MPNVRIKTLPPPSEGELPRAVTTKIFLVDSRPREDGSVARPLEPNEVVELDHELAQLALARLPHELELTLDPATRPLYFSDADKAAMTSQSFNPNTHGRAEQAKAAMAEMLEEAQSGESVAEAESIIERQERQIAELQAQVEALLGQQTEETLEDVIDADLDAEGVEAGNNAAVREDDDSEPEPPRRQRRRRAAA